MKQLAEVRTLRVNRYMIIDEEPCKIMSITTSKPGKHGDRQKRSIVKPVKHKVHVPIIDKRNAQVVALMGANVQLMDLETYETFEMSIPDEYKGQLEPGKEISYLEALGRKKITRV